MKLLGADAGDIVEIQGGKKSVAKCFPLYPSDEKKGIIRLDGLTRTNVGITIGDSIQVKKIKATSAEKIIISPLDSIPAIDAKYLSSALENIPLTKDDIIMVPYFGGKLTFKVLGTIPTDAVIVTDKTLFQIGKKSGSIGGVALISYEDIGGLTDEIKKVKEMIELPLKHPEIFENLGVEAPKGILLFGVPGTGKTLLAKAVANESNAHFISISGPEIMSKFYGDSEARVREIFKEAKANAPSIIFIDEIDSIAPKRDEVSGEVERRVVSQLLSIMDGLEARGKVIVIAATNRPNALDPALRRPGRFDREMEIRVPNKQGRHDILLIHTRNMPLNEDVDLEKIASKSHGYVGADLEYLCKEAAMKCLRRVLPEIDLADEKISAKVLEKLVVYNEDFHNAFREITPSGMREVFIEIPDVSWADVGGLQNVKRELQEAVEWPLKYPMVYANMGYKIPRGILLHGQSGTGKTLLAKAIATESESNFISVKGPELISKWMGESERAIREIFRKARQASPCIIFFDEIDAIASTRGRNAQNQTIENVVSQLLTEMDGLEDAKGIILLAATNRPDMLDTALLRSGRFGRHVEIPLPDLPARKEILSIHFKEKPLANEVDLNKLAERLNGFSGADIKALCQEAILLTIRKAIKSDIDEDDEDSLARVCITENEVNEAIDKVGKSIDRARKSYEKEKQNSERIYL